MTSDSAAEEINDPRVVELRARRKAVYRLGQLQLKLRDAVKAKQAAENLSNSELADKIDVQLVTLNRVLVKTAVATAGKVLEGLAAYINEESLAREIETQVEIIRSDQICGVCNLPTEALGLAFDIQEAYIRQGTECGSDAFAFAFGEAFNLVTSTILWNQGAIKGLIAVKPLILDTLCDEEALAIKMMMRLEERRQSVQPKIDEFRRRFEQLRPHYESKVALAEAMQVAVGAFNNALGMNTRPPSDEVLDKLIERADILIAERSAPAVSEPSNEQVSEPPVESTVGQTSEESTVQVNTASEEHVAPLVEQSIVTHIADAPDAEPPIFESAPPPAPRQLELHQTSDDFSGIITANISAARGSLHALRDLLRLTGSEVQSRHRMDLGRMAFTAMKIAGLSEDELREIFDGEPMTRDNMASLQFLAGHSPPKHPTTVRKRR